MNDASLSQTAGRAKTRQPGLLVKPAQIVLSSYPWIAVLPWQPFLFRGPQPGNREWLDKSGPSPCRDWPLRIYPRQGIGARAKSNGFRANLFSRLVHPVLAASKLPYRPRTIKPLPI